MQAFVKHNGLVAPIDRANVDTDALIPKQFLKSIQRTGFGPNLFDEWRYLDQGQPGEDCSGRPLNKEFVLNQPRYQDTTILLARANFGCGSSREHAVWALEDFGIRAVIAPSFAEIFFNNCFKNGVLPIILSEDVVSQLIDDVSNQEGYRLDVDLPEQCVITAQGERFAFEINGAHKHNMLNGLDDIDLTLQNKAAIHEYERAAVQRTPWLFSDIAG
ncbi:MAG: 3-isopropylmalate dehydratase small subunit [Immundisolibacteraceae bacterium]|nr:3-isopropylmalate dehydratase small subunit [Immundisolibacteraceae bacterium]